MVQRTRLGGVVSATLLLMLASAPAALATSAQGRGMLSRWTASDRCIAQAQQLFPDYTPESNAKRDAQIKQCLAGSNLPPRDFTPPRQ